MGLWENTKLTFQALFGKKVEPETPEEEIVTAPAEEEVAVPEREVVQMDESFICGVGMVVTGVDKDLMRQALSAYKQYCDAYGKTRITVSSLKNPPFTVSANGSCENLLMFFVPFDKENDVLIKLKEYGVEHHEWTSLESDPKRKCMFVTQEKKAVERIVGELGITPEYVNITFWDSGLSEDKSQDDDNRVDFGREVVRNIWFVKKFIEIATRNDNGRGFEVMAEVVPTMDQVQNSSKEEDRRKASLEKRTALLDWGKSRGYTQLEISHMAEEDVNSMYEEMLSEISVEADRSVIELSETMEEFYFEDLEERRVVE